MIGIDCLLCLPTPYQPPANGLFVNLELNHAFDMRFVDLQTILATDSEMVKNAPEIIKSDFGCQHAAWQCWL